MTALRHNSFFLLLLVSWQLLTSTAVYLRHSHTGASPTHHHCFSPIGNPESSPEVDANDDESVDHTHFIFLGFEFCFSGDHEPLPGNSPHGASIVHGLLDAKSESVIAVADEFVPETSFELPQCSVQLVEVEFASPRSRIDSLPAFPSPQAGHLRSGILRS